METIKREILFFGKRVVLACDGQCEKAWGHQNRAKVTLSDNPDDFAYLADYELGKAPADPGTYEGDHGKPPPDQKLESKWCARECERSVMERPGDPIELPDLNQRFYNIAPHKRPLDPWDNHDGGPFAGFFIQMGESSLYYCSGKDPKDAIEGFLFNGRPSQLEHGTQIFIWRAGDPRPDIPEKQSIRSLPIGEPRVFRLSISIREVPND
jgi:hypothetical protein